MKRLTIALLLAAAAALGSNGGTARAADIAAGKAVAEKQCQSCHGLDGKALAPAIPNLAGQPERYILAALSEYRHGQRIHATLKRMAEQLTPADELNVAAYYASLPPVANGHADVIFKPYQHGEELAQACLKCHGPGGNSTTSGTPSLAAQQPGYLVAAIQEYLAGARQTPPMHALIRDLKTVDLESLSLYFASQTPTPRKAPPFGDAAAGGKLTTLCSGCHGVDGASADSRTPNLAAQDPQYLVDALKAYQAGRKHPAMQRAVGVVIKNDQEAQDIAAFYATRPPAAAERGQTLVQDIADKCNRCHSPNVDNPSLAIPNIRGQDYNYLVMTLRAYRDGRRESSVMHNMTLPYGDAIIEGVASYYATQPAK